MEASDKILLLQPDSKDAKLFLFIRNGKSSFDHVVITMIT